MFTYNAPFFITVILHNYSIIFIGNETHMMVSLCIRLATSREMCVSSHQIINIPPKMKWLLKEVNVNNN